MDDWQEFTTSEVVTCEVTGGHLLAHASAADVVGILADRMAFSISWEARVLLLAPPEKQSLGRGSVSYVGRIVARMRVTCSPRQETLRRAVQFSEILRQAEEMHLAV